MWVQAQERQRWCCQHKTALLTSHLRHHRARGTDEALCISTRLTGLYRIGEATFDLTDYLLPWSFVIRRVPSELVISFGAIELRFTQKERPI